MSAPTSENQNASIDDTGDPGSPEGRQTLRQRVAVLQQSLEDQYREEAEDRPDEEEISERAEADAQYFEAESWLQEKWGEKYPCPVCRNVKWIVSFMFPTYNSFLSFQVTCRYCGHSMSVVPGLTDLDRPVLPDEQLQLPEGE